VTVYPAGLRLDGRRVVVLGGGQAAHRRVVGLLEARATVTLVATLAGLPRAMVRGSVRPPAVSVVGDVADLAPGRTRDTPVGDCSSVR
jgi:uroporphyrin-III C-methyltransferase / precorrin-2 dehydrogenase / sirohydrochlorin ferrochelatase